MGIGPITTARSGGDDRWMGSRHAVENAHAGTLSAEAFATAPGVEDGIVPGGYPLTELEAGTYGPFDGTTLSGFNVNPADVSTGDEPCAVMWHGRIKADYLPVDDFAYPAGTAFVFEGGTAAEGGAA